MVETRNVETEHEIWRSGPNPKAKDVRLRHGLTEDGAQRALSDCYADKADGYPDAAIEFYIVRATTTRQVVPIDSTEFSGAENTAPQPVDDALARRLAGVLRAHADCGAESTVEVHADRTGTLHYPCGATVTEVRGLVDADRRHLAEALDHGIWTGSNGGFSG